MDYLEISQQVKAELLSAPNLLNIAQNAFNGGIEPFSFGGTVNLYHLEMLSSGLYVALRVFRTDAQAGKYDLESQIKEMEQYCQNAEYLFSEGYPVPAFCVGVVSGEKAGIFTEDLSVGGREDVEHNRDDAYAFVGSDRRKVFIDIDTAFRVRRNIELRYFLESNSIRL